MINRLSESLKETPEISRIYEDKHLAIFSNNPAYEDWHGNLYLKIFTKNESGKYITISRLSMLNPEYVECEYTNYKFTSKEIDSIIKVLNSHIDGEDCDTSDNITIWQLAIKCNNIYRQLPDNNMISMDLPIPDYSVLK